MDSRFRGNDGGEAAHFTRKLSLEFPRIFFAKNGVNAGICRRESDGGGGENRTAAGEIPIYIGMVKIGKEFTIPANAGISAGDSDLHRNGKSWKLGK